MFVLCLFTVLALFLLSCTSKMYDACVSILPKGMNKGPENKLCIVSKDGHMVVIVGWVGAKFNNYAAWTKGEGVSLGDKSA